jgi:hypothetical protein
VKEGRRKEKGPVRPEEKWAARRRKRSMACVRKTMGWEKVSG